MLWFDDGDIAAMFIRKHLENLYYMHRYTYAARTYASIARQEGHIYAKKLPEKAADMLKRYAGKL